MHKNDPIVVIGGGPCGSFVALSIARQNIPVTVFEEHNRIGYPCHCTGHVGIKGLHRLGLDVPDDIIVNRIRGARFYSPSCKELVLDHGSSVTYVIDRSKFDDWLAGQAKQHGATYVLNSRVESMTSETGRRKLVVEGSDGSRQLSCDLVVDAEGYPPTLLRSAGLRRADPSQIVNGVTADAENLSDADEEFVELFFSENYSSGFFAWIVPKQHGSARIGLGVRGRDPVSLLRQFIDRHPIASERLKNCRITRLITHPIVVGGPTSKTFANGLLEVGDAASQVKPTTGGGIITGMLCSQIAAEIACEAWRKTDFTARFLSRYQSKWKKILGKDFLVMHKIRTRLDKMSDDRMNSLFELALKTKVMNDIQILDDIDLQGSSFIGLTKNPRSLINLIRFVFGALTT